MKKKILTAILSGLLIATLAGCGNQPPENDMPESMASADTMSVTGRETGAESSSAPETSSEPETSGTASPETKPQAEKEEKTKPAQTDTSSAAETSASPTEQPAETAPPKTDTPKPTEPPKQTETPKPTEQPKETEPPKADNPPETEKPEPTPENATAADCGTITDKIVEYLNGYRSTPATKLPGLTGYAEYRSRQIISNFEHDTIDQRAAATALQYGEYVDPALYGMNGEPYYSANAREAIAKGQFFGTADSIAQQFAALIRNSASHWEYVGSGDYLYIAAGVSYQKGTWYCTVVVTAENTDNK